MMCIIKTKKTLLFSILFFFGSSYAIADPTPLPQSSFTLAEKDIRPGKGKTLKSDIRDKILLLIRKFADEKKSPCCHSLDPFQEKIGASFSYSERHTDTWESLEKKVRSKGENSFHLLGFGSLLDPRSSRDFPSRRSPAIAFGVRRFFGFIPPSPERSSLGMPEHPHQHEQLRLSTRITKKESDLTNGVLLEIHLGDEMKSLRKREKGYDLVRVPILKIIKNADNGGNLYEVDEAYILTEPENDSSAQELSVAQYPLSPPKGSFLSPHVSYLYICLRGAQILSEQISGDTCFTQLFLETTFLKDEATSLTEWFGGTPTTGNPLLLCQEQRSLH